MPPHPRGSGVGGAGGRAGRGEGGSGGGGREAGSSPSPRRLGGEGPMAGLGEEAGSHGSAPSTLAFVPHPVRCRAPLTEPSGWPVVAPNKTYDFAYI